MKSVNLIYNGDQKDQKDLPQKKTRNLTGNKHVDRFDP